jgi:hypothetical protein
MEHALPSPCPGERLDQQTVERGFWSPHDRLAMGRDDALAVPRHSNPSKS